MEGQNIQWVLLRPSNPCQLGSAAGIEANGGYRGSASLVYPNQPVQPRLVPIYQVFPHGMEVGMRVNFEHSNVSGGHSIGVPPSQPLTRTTPVLVVQNQNQQPLAQSVFHAQTQLEKPERVKLMNKLRSTIINKQQNLEQPQKENRSKRQQKRQDHYQQQRPQNASGSWETKTSEINLLKGDTESSVPGSGVNNTLVPKSSRSAVQVFNVGVLQKDKRFSAFPPVQIQVTDHYSGKVPTIVNLPATAQSIKDKETRQQFEIAVQLLEVRLILLQMSQTQLTFHTLIREWSAALIESVVVPTTNVFRLIKNYK